VLRTTLAAYVGRSRGVRADPARIVVCAGFSQGLTLVSQVLRDLGMTEMAFEDRRSAGSTPSRSARANGSSCARGRAGLDVSQLTSPSVW